MSEVEKKDVVEEASEKAETKIATIIYLLYMASIFVGITYLIGLIMAYVNMTGAPLWLKTHYRFQIRTFWIGLLFALIAVATMVIGVGMIIGIAMVVWMLVRCIIGLKLISRNEPIPKPETWFW